MCRAYTKQKPIFYVLDANVVVKTRKCHEQRCRLNPSTAWSILQGLKIINGQFVLGGEFYYSWFEFARRSICLKSLIYI